MAGEKRGRPTGWLIAPQPLLRTPGLVVLLVAVNAIVPFSLDIYTPAVPEMPGYFNTTEAIVNLTIMGFFLFYAVGLLLFGPVSDKLGRKPVLVGGMVVYCVSSALCACSVSIYMLIVVRVTQALGAGAVNAVSTALVKDCFEESSRATMLAIIQVLAVVGPIIAPLLGGFIIQIADWHAVFWFLTALSAVCTVMSCMFRESLPPDERVQTGVFSSFAGLGKVLRHRKFMLILFTAAAFAIPFMAYIEVGSYIYVDFFGETQQVYTYYFAATAAFSVLGPVIYVRFLKNASPYKLTYIILGVCLVVGVVMCFVGDHAAWLFAVMMALFSMAEATARPYTTDMLLALRDRDTGAASSMINFMHTIVGVIGMALIMLPFPDYVIGVGVLMVASMIVGIGLWVLVCRE